MGIENNNMRNFKDLQGMQRNAKSLKRNESARKEILIAPSKLPRFSSAVEILTLNFLSHRLQQMSASGSKIRGTDGKSTSDSDDPVQSPTASQALRPMKSRIQAPLSQQQRVLCET